MGQLCRASRYAGGPVGTSCHPQCLTLLPPGPRVLTRMSKSDSSQTLRIKCPECSKSIRVPTSMRGKSGKCPACGHRIQIPEAKLLARKPTEAWPSAPAENPYAAFEPPAPVAAAEPPDVVSAGIQKLESRATPAVWLLRITVAVMAFRGFIFWYVFDSGRSEALEVTAAIALLAQLLSIVVTWVFFLRWKYQASANLHVVCKRRLKFSPGRCCWAYFIPILNFFYPMRTLNEIQSRSKANVGYMVWFWWPLWIVGGFVTQMSLSQGLRTKPMCVLSIASASLGIIAMLFLIAILKTVTEKQRRYGLAIQSSAA